MANGAPRDAGNSAAAYTLSLGGLVALDADAAGALAEFKGRHLTLNSRALVAGEAAVELAGFTCGSLTLRDLTRLDQRMATAVAGFKGRPTLAGDFMIAPQAARMRSAFRTQELNLAGLDVIDAETASALARSRAWSGEVWHMTTLSADVVREEPDGSPTDDFMIPKGFEYRLRRPRTAPAADRAD